MATKLEQNTLDLQALLEAANELPEEKKIQDSKTVSPTTSEQTVTPDSGYDGIAEVTVEAIPDQYQDITTPLADLNAANGGTAAATIGAAVDNTEGHASDQESLIAQISAALEGKVGGGGSGGAVETCAVTIKHYPTYDVSYMVKRVVYQTLDTSGSVVINELLYANGDIDDNITEFVINAVAPSVLFVEAGSTRAVLTNATKLDNFSSVHIIAINGEATLEFQPTA